MERLETSGPPVGLLRNASFEEQSVQLEAGDLLLVFSDGVSEVNDPSGEIWNEEELETVVGTCAGLSAHEAHGRILDAVKTFANAAEPSDDITLAVYRIA